MEADRILAEMEETKEVGRHQEIHRRSEGSDAVSCGTVFTTDEYQSAGLFIGNLAFDCIDFGENLKLSTILKQKLRVGEDIATKKCTALALAAGVAWASQGQPERCPSRRRIDLMASGLRLDELSGAVQALEQAMGEPTEVAMGIRSLCHDAIPADHERDYQALGMFLMPSIWEYLACEVVVLEIQANQGAIFHTYPACPVGNDTVIFLVARQMARDVGKTHGRVVLRHVERLAFGYCKTGKRGDTKSGPVGTPIGIGRF